MVFMDYRDYVRHKVHSLEAEFPTFLYAMPMSDTKVFFEVSAGFFGVYYILHGYAREYNAVLFRKPVWLQKKLCLLIS